MSGRELFNTFEQTYFEHSNSIKRDIASVAKLTGEKRKTTLRNVQKTIEKAQSSIKSMEMEANSIVAPEVQADLKKRLQTYKKDLNTMRTDMKKAEEAKDAKREELLSGAHDEDLQVSSEDYKQRLINNTKRLDKSSASIHRSLQVLDETHQMAVDTARNLREQGDRIRDTTSKVEGINEEVNTGSRAITRMNRRQITNKIIMILVILVLIAIIGVILFFIGWAVLDPLIKMFKKEKTQ